MFNNTKIKQLETRMDNLERTLIELKCEMKELKGRFDEYTRVQIVILSALVAIIVKLFFM